jgi:cytochrome bd-type quinol oxidase subunit 1
MNKIIVAVCGSLLVAVLAWYLYQLQRGKNYDQRIKRSSWWMLVVLLSVIYAMIAKLTGTSAYRSRQLRLFLPVATAMQTFFSLNAVTTNH